MKKRTAALVAIIAAIAAVQFTLLKDRPPRLLDGVPILCDPYKKEAYHHRYTKSDESVLSRLSEHDSVTCGKDVN